MPPKAAKKEEPKKDEPKKEEPKKEQPKKEERPPTPPPAEDPKEEPEQAEEEQQPEQELDDEANRKKKQADMFKKYLEQTGIAMAFQVIFAQILDKKVEEQKVFSYTAMRLRQIGEDLQKIKLSKK